MMRLFLKRLYTFIVAVTLVTVCAGCAERKSADVTTSNESQTTTAVSTVGTTSAETTTVTTITTETTTVPETTDVTTTEFVMPDDGNGYPEKLYVEYFISSKLTDKAEGIKQTREDFSKTNKFIDYEFIAEPIPSDISENIKKKAETLAADGEAFKKAAEEIYLLEPFSTYDLIDSGEAKPEFSKAYEYDFDGEPGNERFIIVSLPELNGNSVIMSDLLIFENSNGDMMILGFVDHCTITYVLDYGEFKQFIFGGTGLFGMREHTAVYGVISGKPKVLIDDRIWIDESSKKGCFLYHGGMQDFNELMVYDTNTNEYRTVFGYPIDTRKLKALNKYNDIDDFERIEIPDDSVAFFVVGEKYLVGRGGVASYVYENGRFSKKYILGSPMMFLDDDSDVEWFDVDVDYALSVSKSDIG